MEIINERGISFCLDWKFIKFIRKFVIILRMEGKN